MENGNELYLDPECSGYVIFKSLLRAALHHYEMGANKSEFLKLADGAWDTLFNNDLDMLRRMLTSSDAVSLVKNICHFDSTCDKVQEIYGGNKLDV